MAKGGFPGMGGANMQQLMKQAQKMQQDMQRMQQELQTREFTATDAAINIAPDVDTQIGIVENALPVANALGVELPKVAVLSAVNEAMRMAEEATNSEVSKLTGGMGLGF